MKKDIQILLNQYRTLQEKIIKESRQGEVEGVFLEDGILYSLFVRLRLGEFRDIILGYKDQKRYFRKDSVLKPPAGEGTRSPFYLLYQNSLMIIYPSGASPFNRIFFNLKGHGVGNIEDHNLTIQADYYIDVDSDMSDDSRLKVDLNSKNLVKVDDTPMDFRCETPIGERIRMGYDALVRKKGYDHTYLLRKDQKNRKVEDFFPNVCSILNYDLKKMRMDFTYAATLMDRSRTLRMDVYTSFPGMYVYTANGFSGKDIGKGGCIYPKRAGVMLAPCEIPNFYDTDRDTCHTVIYQFKSYF